MSLLSNIKGAWHRVFKTVFYSPLCADIITVSKTLSGSFSFIPKLQLWPPSLPELAVICPCGAFHFLSIQHLSPLCAQTEGEDSHWAGSTLCTSRYVPRIRQKATIHACSNGTATHHCWISSAGTRGKRWHQGCAELWERATVCVSCEVRNVTGLRVRLSAFIIYCSVLISDLQNGFHASKGRFYNWAGVVAAPIQPGKKQALPGCLWQIG